MLSLASFVDHAYSEFDGFGDFLRKRLTDCPSGPQSPWQAAIYNDEVSPGNQLKGCNTRKVQVWYVAFVQYGKEHLWREELWLPLLMIRSVLVKKMPGGLSSITAELVQRTFRDNQHCLETGILLTHVAKQDAWTFIQALFFAETYFSDHGIPL